MKQRARVLCLSAGLCLASAAAGAVPVVLYDNPGVPFDHLGQDDSKITNVTLTAFTTGVMSPIGAAIGAIDNPRNSKLTRTFTFEEITGWEKSFSKTLSSSVGSSLSAEYLVGATINSSLSTSFTIGGSISGTSKRTDSITVCAVCEKFDVIAYPLYTLIEGTVTWYEDIAWPDGFAPRSDTWDVKLYTGTKIAIENGSSYAPCPVPVPPAAAFMASALALLGFGAGRARRRERSRWGVI